MMPSDAERDWSEPEITDLRPGSGSRLSPWSAASLTRGLSGHQRLIRLGSAVAAIAFAVAVLVASMWHPGAAPQATGASRHSPYAPLERQGGSTCVTDAAWSPDSRSYAVVGYQGICLTENYVPGIVDVYDAAGGRLVHWFVPDGPILRAVQGGDLGALPTPAPAASKSGSNGTIAPSLIVTYRHILWSPDGQRLALTFSVLPTSPDGAASSGRRQDGMLVADLTGANARVSLQNVAADAPVTGNWRIDGGAAAPSSTLPAAPGYHWSSDGTLAPVTSSLPASSRVGTPGSDAGFTIWQPGTATRLSRGAPGAHDAYEWTTSIAAWSPNGTAVVDAASLTARLQPEGLPAPDAQTLAYFQLDQTPLLPVRDAALAAMLDDLSQPSLSTDFQANRMSLAWRPDGRIMAAYSDSPYGVTGATLNLYDCATGRKLAALLPLGNDGTSQSAGTLLRWSPDGSSLLLVSGPLGSVTLWGSGTLPA